MPEEVDRLADFILQEFPQEIGRGDPIRGESAVNVAIRLLTELKEFRSKEKKCCRQ